MNDAPLVTVVIPARNEEGTIVRALEAIADQDYPLERLEVLVVDGASTDRTGAVASAYLEREPFGLARVLSNPRSTTPTSLNVGLSAASGDYLCRVDARSLVPPGYVRRCVELLVRSPEISVVGGRQRAIASATTARARGIARALNNRWSTGLARYRRGGPSGPTDTVYLGAFRTNDVRRFGGWDERLSTNQDYDLNRRLAREGLVWFEESLAVGYLGRSDLWSLWRQHARFGTWKVEYWRVTGSQPSPRQVTGLAGILIVGVATAAWILGGERIGARTVIASGVALTALTTLDVAGATDDHTPTLPTRITAIAAIGTVVSGWAWGVIRGLVGRPE